MPYEKRGSKTFEHSYQDVYKAALNTVEELGGKVLKDQPDQKLLHAQMDKRMKGEMLGDRSKLEMTFSEDSENQTTISIFAYPLNAVGQKLMFGARKGVVERVLNVFFDTVDKHLQ